MLQCTFENGNKTSLRHAVVDMLVIEQNKILLVKRAPHLLNGNKYALVGGYVDRNETTKEAAKREVLEETGYESEVLDLFRINDNPNRTGEDRQNIEFVYLVKPLKKVAEPDQESKEVKWFELDNLPSSKEFAFDHYETIKLFLKHLKTPSSLPILVK